MPETEGGVREVKSAARTVDLLELLAARGDRPARLQELADEMRVPRSSMYALLQTLIGRGWVRTDTTGALYGIGIRALLTGTGYLDSDPRVRAVRPYLDEASEALGETTLNVALMGEAPRMRTFPEVDSLGVLLESFGEAIETGAPFAVSTEQMLDTVGAFEATIASITSGQPIAVAR